VKDRKELEALFHKHGYTDFKWVDPGEVVVSQDRFSHRGSYGIFASDEPLRVPAH